MKTKEENAKSAALATWFRKNQKFFDMNSIADECRVGFFPFIDWIRYFDEASIAPRWPREWADLEPVEAWAKEHGFRYADSPEETFTVELSSDMRFEESENFAPWLLHALGDYIGRHIVENKMFHLKDVHVDRLNDRKKYFYQVTVLRP